MRPAAVAAVLVALAFPGPTRAMPVDASLAGREAIATEAVYGGAPISEDPRLWPSVVSLGNDDCTGVLIAPNIVLTAGHCVTYLMIRKIAPIVRFFGPSGAVFEQRSAINWRAHPRHMEPYRAYDIGLVLFPGALPEGHKPARGLDDASAVQAWTFPFGTGTSVLMAGVGFTDANRTQSGPRFARLNVDGVDEVNFRASVSRWRPFTKIMTCGGDSGGPAFLEDKTELLLAGITIKGPHDCKELLQSEFSSVPALSSWIDETVQDLRKTLPPSP